MPSRPAQPSQPPVQSPRRTTALSRLIYAGVALASGGIALYVPLVLAMVGASSSGVWAASVLFATNLGRVIGAWEASRQRFWTERPAAIVATILLEGLGLFAMVFAAAPWSYAIAALVAGIGSGLSFPGMKAWLLRLPDQPPARLFAGLSLALRLGMLWGYGLGALVSPQQLPLVFTLTLLTFVGYAAAMAGAMRRIAALPPATPSPPPAGPGAPADEPLPLPLPLLIGCCAAFWLLMIQPTVAMSLHVPRHLPALPLTTTYAITTATILLLQATVTARARTLAAHARYLAAGSALQGGGFLLMAAAGTHGAAVVVAAVLLALGQVFFVPSSDVLVTAHARARSVAPGPLLARQLFHQNVGVMLGSLAAGVLFDLALRAGWPGLTWAPGAVLALGVAALLARRRRP